MTGQLAQISLYKSEIPDAFRYFLADGGEVKSFNLDRNRGNIKL